jgi:hypothetical protein
MYVRGYLQGSENGRVVTIALPHDEGTESAEVATSDIIHTFCIYNINFMIV